jgi:hypothetical protein
MSRRRQNFLRCLGLWILAAAPLQAQSDSTAAAPNLAPPERIAVLDISAPPLTRKESQNFAAALAKICRDDSRFIVTAENTLTVYLKKRRSFSIFIPDSVQALCKNLRLHHLLVSSVERAAAEPALWQITLRRLDGGTGQITKIFAGEYRGDLTAADSFPLRDMLTTLLESPDIVMPVENTLTEMPLTAPMPEMMAPPVDSASAIQAANKRGRSWWWYVTGAALVSGGSAAILLKNPAKPGATGKTILPEPPDPPK